MTTNRLRLFLAAALLIVAFQPAAAQKRHEDPRPLQGLDRSAIPTYSSVDAYLAANPSHGSLVERATVIGTADRVLRSVSAPQIVGSLPSGGSNLGMMGGTSGAGGAIAGKSGQGDLARVVRANNGTVRWMQGSLGGVDASALSAGKASGVRPYIDAAIETIERNASVFALREPARELRPLQAGMDELGYVHARFKQEYEGIPVWGRDMYVHFDDKGSIYAINGTYEPTPAGLSTTPGISADGAKRAVISDLKAEGRWAPVPEAAARMLGVDRIDSRLVFYPDPSGSMRLAYEVSLHPNLIEWYSYLVDARTSEVLHKISRHCSALPHDPDLPPPTLSEFELPALGTGTFLSAAAPGLDGVNRNIRTYRHDDGGHHLIWDLPNLDPATFEFPNLNRGGVVTFSAGNTDGDQDGQITTVVSDDNTWNDPTSISAHDNARLLYEYYKSTFDRNAIDGQDSPIFSVIHITSGGQPMDNAYWNGRFMAYGDGAQAFTPLAGGLDVAAHEMTHGVVEHTAGLVYQFQPGALNESFADVFGVMLDREDFLIGEDVVRPNFGPALRDMLNPDNPQLSQPQPAHMSAYQNLSINQDNGGVHVNSGIPNRAAALIIQAIGHDKVQEIYYRALTNYLTRNSQFGDARNAVEQSARDLYGEGAEVAAVQQAFDAVGILSTTGTGGGGGNDLPPVAGGQSLITFMLDDGSIGVVDVTDPNNLFAGIYEDPAAVARVDLQAGDFSQLSTPRSGERIWFVNANRQLAYVEVQTGEVSVFNNLQLAQPGDLWNVSISPDESYVALVSAYANDPTLYIFNGETIGAVALTPETTQEGIQSQTIQYPDVVSWSPNPQFPRIAFDAYNEVQLKTGLVSYWGIYEIDFGIERIYNLLPAQPAGISVGNVTYSNTDSDIFVFNAIDETFTWDIVLADFSTGQVLPLDIPSVVFSGGGSIQDAMRPTFSPDDGMIAFSSPSNGVLGFIEFASESIAVVDLGAAVYNPRWFVLGGSAGSQNREPVSQFSANVTEGEAPLEITFDASASSDPDGDPLAYRWDFGDGTFGSGMSAVHTYSQTGNFEVSLTVTDGGGLSSTSTLSISVSAGAVAIDDEHELPTRVALHPNHPNPFNPTTVLHFDLPKAGAVELIVFDVLGRPVERLVNAVMQPGRHELRFEADDLPSGTYLVRLRAGETVQTRTITLLR